ncbi:MAG: response regulator, partial [Clostridium sp.]
KEEKVDLVLMDIRMPIMNGVECTKILKNIYPHIKILILTTFDDDDYIIEGLSNGADGYILKDIEGDKLLESINDCYKGNFMLPSNIGIKLAKKLSGKSKITREEKNILNDFSDREIEVSKLMILGLTNKEISKTLFISEGTVKNYISNIYSKLGSSDRTSVVLKLKEVL